MKLSTHVPILKALPSPMILCIALFVPTVAYAQHYTQSNLVSNTTVTPAATILDPNLKNPWGMVASATSPWWVSNNAGGTSTLYSMTLAASPVPAIIPINGTGIVAVPNAPSQPAPGIPTGIMFNGSPTDFLLAPGLPARFIFATEDGTISGWNSGPTAVIKVDNSQSPNALHGAIYKGAAIAEIDGKRFILAANFRSGRIDVFDSSFNPVQHCEELFDNDGIPRGYAPFNVRGIGPNIYVTYAKQDAAKHDLVMGPGLGFVEVFDHHGRRLAHLQHGPWFNGPWGIALAPANFGEFSHALLIGQFGDGTVAAFNPLTGRFLGNVLKPDGSTFAVPGLWELVFGNDGAGGFGKILFFTAGINDEQDGLLGALTPIAAEQDGDEE